MYKLYSSKVETLYQVGLLLAIMGCLPSANQYQACLVQSFYGRIQFLHVERPYNPNKMFLLISKKYLYVPQGRISIKKKEGGGGDLKNSYFICRFF